MPAVSETRAAVPAVAQDQARDRVLLAGIGLSSFSALLLELALTRLFSVVLFYHFAFLAISIALLGLGAGGVFAYLGKRRLLRFETRHLMAGLSAANALIVPCVLEVVLRIPVSLELSRQNFLRLTAMYLVSAIPFLVTGLQFSIVFARESAHIPRLYGADLTGVRSRAWALSRCSISWEDRTPFCSPARWLPRPARCGQRPAACGS